MEEGLGQLKLRGKSGLAGGGWDGLGLFAAHLPSATTLHSSANTTGTRHIIFPRPDIFTPLYVRLQHLPEFPASISAACFEG